MATEKQITATPKHGMTATTAVLPFEDANSYDELRQALMDDYRPANTREPMRRSPTTTGASSEPGVSKSRPWI